MPAASPVVVTIKNVFKHCQMSPGKKNYQSLISRFVYSFIPMYTLSRSHILYYSCNFIEQLSWCGSCKFLSRVEMLAYETCEHRILHDNVEYFSEVFLLIYPSNCHVKKVSWLTFSPILILSDNIFQLHLNDYKIISYKSYDLYFPNYY